MNKTEKVEAKYLEYTSAAVPKIGKLIPEKLNYLSRDSIITPNLKATYISVNKDNSRDHDCENASSNIFYVLYGRGYSLFQTGGKEYKLDWKEGDIFTIPYVKGKVSHLCESEYIGLFYASDKPLMDYLKCMPCSPRFTPLVYKKDDMLKEINKFNNEEGAEYRNRNGVLLTNSEMIKEELYTITHTMWSLMNSIGPNSIQKPHRHNSIAIDLCVDVSKEAEEKEQVYTLMSENLNDRNELIDPIKMVWKKGCTFTTPPGWWHSHHNESNNAAWVFPVQDAGLHTNMRTLDIRFV